MIFPYQTLETKIEERLLEQCNKLLVDFKADPGNTLSDANDRYTDSMFARVFPNAYSPGEYPLSDLEIADLQYSRLIEIIRYEMVPILNLLEHVESLGDAPDLQVPLLYIVPAMGLEPIEYPGRQNCQRYVYPVNLRLILNREQSAFPDLTTTETESLIRAGLKYVTDRSSFINMEGHRAGYEIPSRVIANMGFHRSTLEGFMAPIAAFDMEFSFIVEEQASLSANPYQ